MVDIHIFRSKVNNLYPYFTLFKHKSSDFLQLKLSQRFHPTAWVVACGCRGRLTVEKLGDHQILLGFSSALPPLPLRGRKTRLFPNHNTSTISRLLLLHSGYVHPIRRLCAFAGNENNSCFHFWTGSKSRLQSYTRLPVRTR